VGAKCVGGLFDLLIFLTGVSMLFCVLDLNICILA